MNNEPSIVTELDRKKALMVFLAIAFAFSLYQVLNLHYTIGDENIYYYMAKETLQGNLPYKDFFFAHPPLQLVGLMIFSVFGIIGMKITALLYTLAIGYIIFLILVEKGHKEAIIGAILFFTSHEILIHALNPVGQDITALFLVLGFYFYLKKSNLFAGISFGLSALSGLYALIIISTILMYDLVLKKDKKHFIDNCKGFFISFGIGNIMLILLFGRKYIDPVYVFQLIRPSGQANLSVFLEFLKYNLILFIGLIVYFLYKEKKKVIIAIILIFLIYLATSPSVFLHYYFLLIPFMVLAASYSIASLINNKHNKHNNHKEPDDKNEKHSIYKTYTFALIVIAALVFSIINVHSTLQATRFSAAKNIANEIGAGKTVFGTDAALIALLSDNRLPTKYLDSNLQRFRAGMGNVTEVISILNETGAYVITGEIQTETTRQKRGLLYYKEYEDFLNNDCKLIEKNFDNYHWLYKC
ncbi:MAG: hypothetical protein Q8O89_04250 [Nanoarchaeota archaeon]|nr:hypothetical protein [Nanoarchaeota archaeon]